MKVDYVDPVTGQASKANIPYDSRGLPVFDDVAKYTTKIEKPANYDNMTDAARKTAEMKQATLDLKKAINEGQVDVSQFTPLQLAKINAGDSKIPGYTWHHNAQSAPNNFQLVPEKIHRDVNHVGEASLSNGK